MHYLKHYIAQFGLYSTKVLASGLSQGVQASDILAGCCSVQMGYGVFAALLGHSQLLGNRWDLLRSVISKVVVEGFCSGLLKRVLLASCLLMNSQFTKPLDILSVTVRKAMGMEPRYIHGRFLSQKNKYLWASHAGERIESRLR